MKYSIVLINLKSGKRAAISIIYINKIIKINDFKEISKDCLLATLATLSNEQKIKIKHFNNSASYCNKGVSFKPNLYFAKGSLHKQRMEHLISSLQDKNKITELTVKVSY